MKRIIIRMTLIVLLILLGFFLYTIGKEHKVFIDNKTFNLDDHTFTAIIVSEVWIDGQCLGQIKREKRKVAKVAGVNHKIIVEGILEKDLIKKRFEKVFRLKTNEQAVINIPAMINNSEGWIVKKIK